jgi:hypothetical protein
MLEKLKKSGEASACPDRGVNDNPRTSPFVMEFSILPFRALVIATLNLLE